MDQIGLLTVILLVLVVLSIFIYSIYRKCVRFRTNDSVMEFNKDDPPIACSRREQLSNMKISRPMAFRKMQEKALPDAHMEWKNEYPDEPVSLEDQISGYGHIKHHKPFNNHLSQTPDHIAAASFDTYGYENI